MNINFYWSIYQNIEKEIIDLSNSIHFDDDQLEIYSMKIAELIIRTVVEIESISKELYFSNGGEKENDNNLYFDTDCLNLLENKWSLSKKEIILSSTNFHFTNFKVITPLKKSNKRGSSSSNWQKAYQGIKHNRALNFKKANIKNLLEATASLFLLNVYYKNENYKLEKDLFANKFDLNQGSNIFSIKLNYYNMVRFDGKYPKNDNFENCTYLVQHTTQSYEKFNIIVSKISDKIEELNDKLIPQKIKEISPGNENIPYEKLSDELKKIADIISFQNQVSATNLYHKEYIDTLNESRYESVLNKMQY